MSSNSVVINGSAAMTFEVSDEVCDQIVSLCPAPVKAVESAVTSDNNGYAAALRDVMDFADNNLGGLDYRQLSAWCIERLNAVKAQHCA